MTVLYFFFLIDPGRACPERGVSRKRTNFPSLGSHCARPLLALVKYTSCATTTWAIIHTRPYFRYFPSPSLILHIHRL